MKAPDRNDFLTPAEARSTARREILAAYDKYLAAVAELGALPYLREFVRRYNLGTIQVSAKTRQTTPTFNARSLDRWLALRQNAGPSGVDGKWAGSGRPTRISEAPDVAAAIKRQVANGCRSSAAVRRLLLEQFSPEVVPPIRSLQRFIADLD